MQVLSQRDGSDFCVFPPGDAAGSLFVFDLTPPDDDDDDNDDHVDVVSEVKYNKHHLFLG